MVDNEKDVEQGLEDVAKAATEVAEAAADAASAAAAPVKKTPAAQPALVKKAAETVKKQVAAPATPAVAQAQALGATLCAGPFDVPGVGRMAVLQDPQGAVIQVMSYFPPAQ